MQEGENAIGRGAECQILLASTQVSKKHCILFFQNKKLEIKDNGSSNGTFVNGVLTKKKLLQNHDRISVGPFVLEVLVANVPAVRTTADSFAMNHSVDNSAHSAPVTIDPGLFKMEEEPKSLVGKYRKKFDDVFLPVVYDFYERIEYPTMFVVMFAIYTFLNLGFTVYPVLQRSREDVLRQAEQQALYISKQVAYLNRQAILEGKEGALITDFAESERNVKEVVVVNLDGRIMAPGARLNEAYNNTIFLKYKELLLKKPELWEKTNFKRLSEDSEVIAFTPIMVLSKAKGINVPGAISVVVYSTAEIALDPGTIGTIFFESLVWSFLLGIVYLYLVYQVSHKPILKLNDDLDKALKGEADSVEKKYQNEYFDALIDKINSALSRIPKASGSAADSASANDTEQLIVDNMMRSLEYVSTKANHPMMMLDTEMRVKLVNSAFEELTGIRGAQGEVIDTVSRDESFPALIKEMAGKAIDAGNEGVQEDYDFPTGGHKIHGIALSGVPGKIEAYLFLFEKTER